MILLDLPPNTLILYRLRINTICVLEINQNIMK